MSVWPHGLLLLCLLLCSVVYRVIFSSSSRSVRRGESGCVVRLSSNSLFAVELDSMEMSSDMVSTRVVVLWELVGGSLVACWRLEIVWLIFGLFGA